MEESRAGERADCLVIGGGPGGLAAALYLARFHLSVQVLDAGESRAASIPLSRNLPGHPDGISGDDLIRVMRRQAEAYGAVLRRGRVGLLHARDHGFIAETGSGTTAARKVLLATGVENLRPQLMNGHVHAEALRRGLLRYCPVCDGYEVTDRRIGVLGSGAHALREAQFLRSYSARVTLIAPYGPHRLGASRRQLLSGWDIAMADGPVTGFRLEEGTIAVDLDGGALRLDTLYAALGTAARAELARGAGAALSPQGGILVDRHQMTSVPGLYAAGDVVEGLDQIAAALGQAAVAATAMRNAICAETPLKRPWRPQAESALNPLPEVPPARRA